MKLPPDGHPKSDKPAAPPAEQTPAPPPTAAAVGSEPKADPPKAKPRPPKPPKPAPVREELNAELNPAAPAIKSESDAEGGFVKELEKEWGFS